MAKNRERQRANQALARKNEERLNSLTEWGTKDPTPKEAVSDIIDGIRNRKRYINQYKYTSKNIVLEKLISNVDVVYK